MAHEIEAKFLNLDVEDCRMRLAALGFACVRPWSLMRRYTFMLPDADKWGRVRDEGNRVTMTYKHAFDTSRIDGTEEVEFEVSSFENAVLFMQKIGFNKHAYQENNRETWMKDGIEVTLNEWPALPAFVEIEADSEQQVRAASDALGFDFSEAVFGGIGRLYLLQNGWHINGVNELTFAKASDIHQQFSTNQIF